MINIDNLIKNATLSKDKVALNAYKNIKAEFQKVQTAKNYKGEWTEQLELQTISKYAKSLEDAIKQFSEAHRDDLVAEYTSELEVVKKLLPEPVNESEIMYELIRWSKNNFENFSSILEYDAEVRAVIPKIIIQIPKKQMGNVIKYVKSKLPTADGKMISEIVKKYIV